jgi:hypothetical protein
MDTKKVEERDGKARATLNVSEEHKYIRPDYDLVLGKGEIGPTGLLAIATLKLKNSGAGVLPEFILRWDDKDDWLDVDSLSKLEKEQRLFRKGIGEYYGHHAVRISVSPRVFRINLVWQGQVIYRGKLKFNLSRDLEVRDTVRPKDTTSAKLTRGHS